MIDHLINVPDEATAQADPVVGKWLRLAVVFFVDPNCAAHRARKDLRLPL